MTLKFRALISHSMKKVTPRKKVLLMKKSNTAEHSNQSSFEKTNQAHYQGFWCSLEVMRDKRVGLATQNVLAIISSFFFHTGNAFPSNGWIADKLNIDVLTVSRAISKLVQLGYLVSVTKKNRRYLYPPSAMPDPREEEVDQPIKGGLINSSRGVDQLVNHNIKTNIKTNNDNVGSLKYIDEGSVDKHPNEDKAVVVSEKEDKDNKLEALAVECSISNAEIKQLAAKYGNERVVGQLKHLSAISRREGIRNPVAYLSVALSKGFKYNSEPKSRQEAGNRQIRPASHDMYDEHQQAHDNKEAEKLGDTRHWSDVMREEREKALSEK